MPLAVVEQEGVLAPKGICDWCGEQIKDVANGNVYFYDDAPEELFYNHKHCAWSHDNYLEANRPDGAVVMSEHLEVFLAQLLGNTGRRQAMLLVDRNRLYETRGRLG